MRKFVINLERREDRRNWFVENNPWLTDCQFWKAQDGKDLTIGKVMAMQFNTNRKWRDPYKNRRLTKGEVACFISHWNLWKYAADNDKDLIIFEDDSYIDQEKFDEAYYEELLKEYGFIYLSHRENEPQDVEIVDDKLCIPAYPYNLNAYAIRSDVAKLLVSTREIKHGIIPVDDMIAKLIPKIKAVALREDVANQASRQELGSDIEPYSENDWFIDFDVHVLTAGDDRLRCNKLMTSGMHHGVYPKNLGAGVEWRGGDMTTPGGGQKINMVREYLKFVVDHDVVVFTDAFDVFYADNMKSIINRWCGFNTDTLFAAEAHCYPDASLAEEYPESETPYRFLNSGCFISQVWNWKEITGEPIEDHEDDQLYFTKQFLSGNFDMKLDYEGYIFQTHEPDVEIRGKQIYNPKTGCYGSIYHGNGGLQSKKKFDSLYEILYPKAPSILFKPTNRIERISDDMLVVDFMTQSQCEDLIAMAEKHGGWGSLAYDKFPAQEIRMKELGLWDELEEYWQKHINPVVESYWHPTQMYGLRDAFVMRYSTDTQKSLACHTDASLVTGSVKLNDDYQGADLWFKRQGISNKDIPVGRCILFPGQVTHGHECRDLISGTKYSLTMWTKRNVHDVGG